MQQLLHVLHIILCWGLMPLAADDSCTQNKTQRGTELERLFDKIIPHDYNYQQPPTDSDQSIAVTFIYLSLCQVAFSKMEFDVEFFVHVNWTDRRLAPDELIADKDFRNLTVIGIPPKTARRLWIPKIGFANCKYCGMGPVISLDHPVFFHLLAKSFFSFYRSTMTFSCAFNLAAYPFDIHECFVGMQLMEYFTKSKPKLIALPFFQFPPEKYVQFGMTPEFEFLNVTVKQECSQKSLGINWTDDQCLQYGIRIQRITSYHLMLVFIPTTVIVMISWISFWLSIESSAPRVTLGLTSLLTLTTQFASEQKNLPPVSYIKALDVWMLMCVFMVFGSLLEFALAHNYRAPKQRISATGKEEPKIVQSQALPSETSPNPAGVKVDPKKIKPILTNKIEVNFLDAISRILFPAIFILFNIVYWPCYAAGA